jgi:lipoic acid synthetase
MNTVLDTVQPPIGKPKWLRVKLPTGQKYTELRGLVDKYKLNTICTSGSCPNMGECWGEGTATFMIIGNIGTRSCGFCAVKTGRPLPVDYDEPRRVAEAIASMNLKHAVITSVNRDELKDGGSTIWAETITLSRELSPTTTIEVLVPDFKGNMSNLQRIIDAQPDILNHNTETVPRLYKHVRPQGRFQWTLAVLAESKRQGMRTKTGIMLGLGETPSEIMDVMVELIKVNVDVLTLGQYLQPTKNHLPVDRFVHPDEFRHYEVEGLKMGFNIVESGPLVRSSYHAERHV